MTQHVLISFISKSGRHKRLTAIARRALNLETKLENRPVYCLVRRTSPNAVWGHSDLNIDAPKLNIPTHGLKRHLSSSQPSPEPYVSLLHKSALMFPLDLTYTVHPRQGRRKSEPLSRLWTII
jgi:hypothetical protein